MPNFQNQLVLAISADENNPITFSKPAPEASPVLTLGKYSKGQVQTREKSALNQIPANLNKLISIFFIILRTSFVLSTT